MLLGRDAERDRLRGLVAAARAGAGGALVVRGEPGIGKTALLEDAHAHAGDLLRLELRPVEPEADLAFAGLSSLLRPLLGRLDALPEPQSAALRAALALGPPVVADRFAAYTATLGLIATAARERPVLVVVDDAHWLDRPSAEALAFAARRLEGEPIALLVAIRAGEPDPFAGAGLERLALGGLDRLAAEALLARGSPSALPAAVTRRLVLGCAGNPLALIELPALLTDAERRGEAPLEDPLPVGAGVTAAFRRRLDGLPAATARALAAAAAGAGPDLLGLAAVLAALGLAVDHLAPAEAAGLVALAGDRVAFRHPLLRSVALELTPAPERRELHRAIAGALDPGREAERRAWHLAAAAVGPDEEAAAALEAAGAGAGARTGYAAAAGALRRAAALTADPERRAVRLLHAATAALMSGSDGTLALVEEARALARQPALRVALARVACVAHMVAGPLDQAYQLIVREAARVADGDPASASGMLAEAAFACSMAGRCRQCRGVAQRAVALAPRADAVARRRAEIVLHASMVLTGDARLVPRDAARRRDPAPLDRLASDAIVVTVGLLTLLWTEALDEAESRLDELVDAARSAGAAGLLGFPLTARAELRLRTARFAEGLADAREGLRVHEDTGQHAPRGHSLVVLAHHLAVLGDEAGCHAHASRALELGRTIGAGSLETYAGHALGALWLGMGRPERAAEPLRAVDERATEHGLRDPSVVMWRPDYVEALARSGRAREAWSQLRVLAEEASRSGSAWAGAATCRCRGLLDDAEPERHFREALAWHDRVPRMPFERARTELAALGRRGSRRDILDPEELTPRESQVAHLVSDGLTNREVATRLYLSEKTVERHLGAVYRKLGLRSRTQLARRFTPA